MRFVRAAVPLLAVGGTLMQCQVANADQSTWFEQQSTGEQQAVVDYAYDRSPVAAAPYPSAASEASNIDSTIAGLSSETEAMVPEVSGSEWQLLSKAALVPDLSAAFPDIGLVTGTFSLGWQIGTGIKKLFALLKGPPDAGTGGSWQWQGLHWYPHGYNFYFGAAVQQTPGAYLYTGYYGGQTFHPARWFESPCTFSGFSGPNGGHLQTGVSTTATCYVAPNTYPVVVDYPYLSLADINPKKPIHPYDASTDGTPTKVSPAPADPGTAAVTSAVQSFLDSDAGAPLASEIDWVEAGASDPMSDPIRAGSPWQAPPTSDWRRWCERSAPGTGASAINSTLNEFTVFETFPAQTLGSVDLLYGTDDVFGAGGNQWSDIQGFGVRKIAAKHGWSAADEAETASTLEVPVTVTGPQGSQGRYRFYGASHDPPDPTRIPAQYLGTGSCRRLVVVDTQQKRNEPRARSIITSYGDWTGAKP